MMQRSDSEEPPRFELHMRVEFSPQIAEAAPGATRQQQRAFGIETWPLYLHCYATHEALPDEPVVLFIPSAADVRPMPLVVPVAHCGGEECVFAPLRDAGVYTFADVQRRSDGQRFSRSLSVNFNGYCTTYSRDGNRCETRLGGASLSIADLERLIDRRVALRIPMIQNTTNNKRGGQMPPPRAPRSWNDVLVKGIVTISDVTLHRVPSGERITYAEFARRHLLPPQMALDTYDSESEAQVMSAVFDVITRSLRAFIAPSAPERIMPPPTRDWQGRFHTPELRWRRRTGPSFVYMLNRSRKPADREFRRNGARIALRRSALSADDAVAFGRLIINRKELGMLDEPYGARENAYLGLMVRLLTLFATAMPYLDDFVNANCAQRGAWKDELLEATEDMKVARITCADDCEGTGSENVMQAQELAREPSRSATQSTGDAETDTIDLLLGQMSRILREAYVVSLLLLAVTNNRALSALELGTGTAGSGNGANDSIPAHTIGILIPRAQFGNMVPPALRAAFDTPSSNYEAMRSRYLPMLVLDGTSRVDPALLPTAEYYSAADSAAAVAHDDKRRSLASALQNVRDMASLDAQICTLKDKTRLTVEIFTSETKRLDRERDKFEHHFYKWFVTLQTVDGLSSVPIADFALVNRRKSTYAVTIDEMMVRGAEAVSAEPFLRITKKEAAQIDMVFADEEPVPRLKLAPYRASSIALPPEIVALARPTTVDASRQPTLLHPRQRVVSVRLVDLGPPELAALRAISALPAVRGVDVDAFRIVDALLPARRPLDMLDVTLHF